MPIIHIPSLMHDLTGGAACVTIEGTTLRQVIENLEAKFPGLQGRLCADERIRPNLAVWIDGQISREGMSAPLGENAEIHFLPAISGG